MNKHNHSRARAALLAALLLCGPALAAGKQPADGQAYGEWKVDQAGDMIRFETHGTKVWGHQFGFILKAGNCDDAIIWVAWSSMKARPAAFKSLHAARLVISTEEDIVPVDLPLSSAVAVTPDLTVFALTNFDFNERFLDLIQRAKAVKVRVGGPPQLLRLLEVTEETFPVKGYAEARKHAVAMCKQAGKGK